MKVGKPSKLAGIFEKVDPKIILGGVIALVAVIAVIVLTVILPALEERGMQISEIKLARAPEKTVYLVGETADYNGLLLLVTQKNGETFYVAASDCEITGFSSENAIEKCVITVNYKGYKEFFTVTVNENEKPVPVLKSIRLEPMPKTQYKVGEWLNVDGAYVVREYVDGSVVKVNLLKTDVYGWEKVTGPGTYTLTVKYSEHGVMAKTTYTITVTK